MTRGNDGERHGLERRFDGAMLEIYERAGRELGYWATRYLQMLRRLGGLETARRLLAARATSDGYERLRQERRLDLTVEAHVLLAEFAPLFTPSELQRARDRLAYYQSEMEKDSLEVAPPDPELLRLLDEAAAASPDRRITYRDRVASFGLSAIEPLFEWVARGGSVGFVSAVLEAIGHKVDAGRARQALRRLRADHPDWGSIIDPAIDRLRTTP